jgi:hypothetical protein
MSRPGRQGAQGTQGARGAQGGFALALVVLMLFAIAMAGVTGYQAVSTELVLSTQNRDGQKALSVARAGLQRFLGEQIGAVVGDSVSYAIGDGFAAVTTRRVVRKDARNHLYYIRSTGLVADPSAPANPARRSVATYAWHRLYPVPLKGALWVSGGTLELTSNAWGPAVVDGFDHSTPSDCPGGGTAGTAGVVRGDSLITSGGTYVGNPDSVGYAGFSAMYDTVGIRWDVLSSPSFPVDFENAMPDFTGLPPESFPIVRFDGSYFGEGSGRGVLIVGGTFWPGWGSWDGIILAGTLGPALFDFQLDGMLIAGLDGANPSVQLYAGDYDFHACNAAKASAALSYLEVVDRAIFEING